MRKIIWLTAAIFAALFASVGSASAATDFGNGCTANTAPANVTLVMTGKSTANPLPVAAPISGVITKAKFNVPMVPTVPTILKVMRTTGTVNVFQVAAQSASIPVVSGGPAFDVRVPVQAGDLLGMSSSLGTLECIVGPLLPADTLGAVAGDAAVGTSPTFMPQGSSALPVVATIEPDADNDGFGDETQDKCPQSAAFQIECPVVILDSFTAPGKSSLTVLVATTNQADITVAGTVKVKKAKKGGGKTRASTKVKLNGGTQTVKGGALARFTVPFPAALKKALKALPAKKSLKATLTATATDLIGRVSTSVSKAKLPGLKP